MRPYYEHAGITIYCADNREILPHLSGIDLVCSSPPYNQMTSLLREPTGSWGRTSGGRGFVEKWQSSGYADDLPEDEYQRTQNEVFSTIAAICNPEASLFYNHQVRWRDGEVLHPVDWFKPRIWRMRQEIIWDRGGGIMFNARMFCRYDERILWYVRGEKWKWNQEVVGYGTVWRIPIEQNKEHPVEYPIEIPLRCILAASHASDTVLDAYMGSGTTLRAAKDTGRKAVGIDIREDFCEIAARRLSQEVFDFKGGAGA